MSNTLPDTLPSAAQFPIEQDGRPRLSNAIAPDGVFTTPAPDQLRDDTGMVQAQFRIHRNILGLWQRCVREPTAVSGLQVDRNRIMNQRDHAVVGQKRPQVIAVARPDDILMPGVDRIARLRKRQSLLFREIYGPVRYAVDV